MRIQAIFALSIVLLSACSKQAEVPPKLDLAGAALPFSRAALEPAWDWLEVPLPAQAAADVALRQAFFRHDFEPLQLALEGAREEGLRTGVHEHAGYRFIEGLQNTGLAGLDACNAWLAARPDAYPAHLACGAMWGKAAWSARGDDDADNVSPARLALMRERFAQSNTLLEKALQQTAVPVEALAILAANNYGLGRRADAEAYLERAHALLPKYAPPYEVKANFSLPEWGGSDQEVVAVLDRAEAAGVEAQALRRMRDQYFARPWRLSNPGDERSYWEQALAEHPSAERHESLLKYFYRAGNWRDLVPAADRMLAAHPGHLGGTWMRAVALERLGHIRQAVAGYRSAAARGHDEALVSLIQAYVQGGLGLPQGDWEALNDVCRHGASLGSAAAANCVGATYWEGENLGAPFHTDVEQALAWHLFAARAGHFNSQYDLGWLLFSGRGPGVDIGHATRVGTFWLRRAAEQGHAYAPKRLRDARLPESEEVEPRTTRAARAGEQLHAGLAALYYTLMQMIGA